MKLLIAGDYVPQRRIIEKLSIKDYSFLNSIRSVTEQVDYSIVNLEAPVSDGRKAHPIEKTGPSLYCPEVALLALKYAGFNCVTLANNHFRDYGQDFVNSTIDLCEKWSIEHIGGGKTYEQARTFLRLLDKKNNKAIGIINACESEWSIANSSRGGSNPLDIVEVSRDIHDAKLACDYVLLITHGGVEWYNLPTPDMQKTFRFFVEMGADVIVNHHQHCISGYELYQGKPIFYGLGNFCFDNEPTSLSFWNKGLVVELDFNTQLNFRVLPIHQCAEDATVTIIPNDIEIESEINQLNTIISSSLSLTNAYEQYVKKAGEYRLSLLQPWQSALMRGLYSKGLLPSVLSNKWKKNALNLFRCASHREILLKYLETQVESNENSHS